MPDRRHPALERRSIRRSFDAAVGSYDEAAVLQRAVADELIDRVGEGVPDHARILDLGSGTGYLAERLAKQCPGADLHALDLSPAPLTPQVILVNLFGSKFSDEFTATKIRISPALKLFGIDFA